MGGSICIIDWIVMMYIKSLCLNINIDYMSFEKHITFYCVNFVSEFTNSTNLVIFF